MKRFIRRAGAFFAENIILLAILSAVSVCVLVLAYFDGAKVSPDSASYLRAAREILRGRGFYVHNPGGLWPEWFSVWPIGYPFMIAAISWLTGSEIYLASKILSILIIWIIGFTLYRRHGRTAWIYALLMLGAGFLSIFYYTWSETTFILGLILFSYWVSDILAQQPITVWPYAKLTFGVLLLFLSRYVGAFALVAIGILLLYNLVLFLRYKNKQARRRALYLTASGAVSGVVILSYLLVNRAMTGYLTGSPREPIEDAGALLKNLFDAQMSEIKNVFQVFFNVESNAVALVMWGLLAAFAIFFAYKAVKARDKAAITPLTFIAIGLMYWCSIVAMRFSAKFDAFNYRLLFPSSILIFLGCIGLFLRVRPAKTLPRRFDRVASLLMAAVLFFLIVTTQAAPSLGKIAEGRAWGYRQWKQSIRNTYEDIPDGSVVLWGEWGLLYLRENVDIGPVKANVPDVDAFFAQYQVFDHVYLYTPGLRQGMDGSLQGNPSLLAYFEQFRGAEEKFIIIR